MKSTNAPTFKQFWRDVERKARDRGPDAVARLADLRAAFRLARELVRAREQRKLTQSAVSKLTGITQADLSRYERGQGNPGFLTLEKLGKVYGGLTVQFGRSAAHPSTNRRLRQAARHARSASAGSR
jgi:ribosome-binding protein aMBF1 (putative translation factor)